MVSAHERVSAECRNLLNGSGRISYFGRRGITEETLEAAQIGFRTKMRFSDGHEGPTFTFPCFDRGGRLLGVHYKSEVPDGKGKRRQRWDDYSDDLLPPKGHGKNPEAPAKVIPFGLDSLDGLEPGDLVIVGCGEEDALSLRQSGYVALSQPGAGLLESVYARELEGFEVVVFYDAGEEEDARKDAGKLETAGAAGVRVVRWPSEAANGADINGRLMENPESFPSWVETMISEARPPTSAGAAPVHRKGKPDRYGGDTKSGEQGGKEPTQAEVLITYADDMKLFHTPDGEPHATIEVNGHQETWPVKGRRFNRLLMRRFYQERRRAPSAQARTDASDAIAARAEFDGSERPVHVRVAGHEAAVYLDLCNDSWEAVEVTPAGWNILSSDALPVRFFRKRGAAPLPHPARGGSVEDLRPFLNTGAEEDFVLVTAWMVGALNPDGPYPLLDIEGEQGSAKSTLVRVVRSVVDPAVAPLRAPPRNTHDLAIAAAGNWILALDNVSGIPAWQSDFLCRLATGGGFATRELYSNDEETIFNQKRPVIANGIETLAVAGDLRDRSIVLDLPRISAIRRRTEREFYRELERVRPRVLGALLDAISAALRNREGVELEELPRMADFAMWVVAAEEALPWESGAFLKAYASNRSEANEVALEHDPVAVAVRELMSEREEWCGTSTELLDALSHRVDESIRRSQMWPRGANSLSNKMKRLAPDLCEKGIEYTAGRAPGGGRTRLKYLKKTGAELRPDRPDRLASPGDPANDSDGIETTDDSAGQHPHGESVETVPHSELLRDTVRDERDDRDDDGRASSSAPSDKTPPSGDLPANTNPIRMPEPGPRGPVAGVAGALTSTKAGEEVTPVSDGSPDRR